MTATRRRGPLHAAGDDRRDDDRDHDRDHDRDDTMIGHDPLDVVDIDTSDHHDRSAPPPVPPPVGEEAVHRPHLTAHTDENRRAFADAVRSLRTGGQSLNLSERTLMVAAGIIAPLGLVFVLLGWYGAARTTNDFEQIPYLISGGLFGLGLVFLGAFFYFAHWLTELVKESRSGSAALLEAVARLQETMAERAEVVAVAGGASAVAPTALVATARGAMAHRADCAVVVGKDDLRHVAADDGLAPCKMCEPYLDEAESPTAD